MMILLTFVAPSIWIQMEVSYIHVYIWKMSLIVIIFHVCFFRLIFSALKYEKCMSFIIVGQFVEIMDCFAHKLMCS